MPAPAEPGPGAAPEPSGAAPGGGSTVEELRRWLGLLHLPLHIGAGVTMLGLLAWTVADIVGRTFFNNPMPGTVELTELAVVVLVYLGLSHAESRDAHITVDLLYVRLGTRAKLALRVFAGLVGLAVISVMTWRLLLYAWQLDDGGYTTGILRLPLYPVAVLAVVGAAAYALAVAANTAVSAVALVRGRADGQ